MDGIETSMYPMISVLPVRVDLSDPTNETLPSLQRTISSMVALEHVSLSKVQNWVRPGETLFETLFSISVMDNHQRQIWDVVESEFPQVEVS